VSLVKEAHSMRETNPYQSPNTKHALADGVSNACSAKPLARFRFRLIPVVLLWSLAAILFAAFATLFAAAVVEIADVGWQAPRPEAALSLTALTVMGSCVFIGGLSSIAGWCWLRAKWRCAVLWTIATIVFGYASIAAAGVVLIRETGLN
jgi:hypothetical protein